MSTVTITNKARGPVTYYLQWGDQRPKEFEVKAGESYTHMWRYAEPNQNRNPTPVLIMRVGNDVHRRTLGVYAAPNSEIRHSKQYSLGGLDANGDPIVTPEN